MRVCCVTTAIIIHPDFHGFPQLPVNCNPGQWEDSWCCSPGHPWNEKCPPALQPRVWLPDCLSFAGRAGTVGALRSATASSRAVRARLEPLACCWAVVTAAAAALAQGGPQLGPWSRAAGPKGQVAVCSVTQSCPTLQPQGLQHTRPPCPSPSLGVCPSSYPLNQ